MTSSLVRFTPALVLGLGSLALLRVGAQERVHLRGPLDSVPRTILGAVAYDQQIPEDERRVAGMDAWLMRTYVNPGDSTRAFTLYVGYYESQTQGKAVHSPKNCLPGAGWEPVETGQLTVTLPSGDVTVNRYVLEKGNQRAVAYYWYQGRDRIAWNEYAVKWELFRDKARYGRSDEALVRVVVPITGDSDKPDDVARSVAGTVMPALDQLLPPIRS